MKNKVAILLAGDPTVFGSISEEKRKLHGLFSAFEKEHIDTQLIVYADTYVPEIEKQLLEKDAVLVWINPIEKGNSRSILDAMLRRISDEHIFVSTNPNVILKIGTKDVLYTTKEMDWGTDVEIYNSFNELREKLVITLQPGISRVLKQYRGNGGNGIWRIEFSKNNPDNNDDPFIRVLHALRNSKEQVMLLSEFLDTIKNLFDNSGKIINQEFISPIPDGMIRCYMTQNKVVGFGQQYVTALVRPENPDEVIEPSLRVYFPKTKPEYQNLRFKMEQEWIPQLEQLFNLEKNALPIIWDADFLFRSNKNPAKSTFALCEINVSSVFPFPEYAVTDIVIAVKEIFRE